MKGAYLQTIIEKVGASDAKVWQRVASELRKPTRNRRTVSVSKLEKYAKDGFTLVVPGKVLSTGTISKKVNVAALQFSDAAADKITKAGGKVMSLEDAAKAQADGKKVMLIG